MTRIVIAGGGLAGSLAALALRCRRPEVDVLLIEQGSVFGGNHTWSYFDTDVAVEDEWTLDDIQQRHWPDHEVRFPRRSRIIGVGYNSIRSSDLDSAVRSALPPECYRLEQSITEVAPTRVKLGNGDTIDADAVIDARGARSMAGQDLGWQKFVGRLYRFPRPHGVQRPVIMDGTVEQNDGYRFIYLLPFSDHDLLVEDTYYSADRRLDREALEARLTDAASNIDGGAPDIVGEESGVLPVLIRGDFAALWPAQDPVPRLGVRGGFFHPTTSYSLPDAAANAALLTRQTEFSASALRIVLRARAEQLWRERRFFQLLNRMLFRAAEPDQGYRILEHFYRLPADLIGRFYAGRLTNRDKLRILTGRPPVPLGRALSAIFKSAA